MKKYTEFAHINHLSPLLIVIMLIPVCLHAQKKNITSLNSVAATYKKVCGDFSSAENSIYSNSVLAAGEDCNTIIRESSSTIYFTAREKIILYPGFTAVAGSNFVARIDSTMATESKIAESPLFNDKLNSTNFSVSPNPFNEGLMAIVNSAKSGKAQISIYNAQGSKLKTTNSINLIKGANKIPLNYPDLAPGVYMLEVNYGDLKMVKKIIKE
ncbi:T9SS type A sorting domain-containing protein [Pollutibacter soli]|uniref:T9SS type A sorting domain-containing protein n=1 Tax=Pollutibacter soli TaxID=3034157 RepID=UPI003013C37B